MKPPDKPMKEFQDMNKVMEMMGQSGNVAQDRNTVPSQTTLLLLLTDCVRSLGMLSYMEADRGYVRSAQVIDALAARIAETVKQISSTVTLKSETHVAPDESTRKGQMELLERIAILTAHRVCYSEEHDPLHGKIHGYCVVCGYPWPCKYAGKPLHDAREASEAVEHGPPTQLKEEIGQNSLPVILDEIEQRAELAGDDDDWKTLSESQADVPALVKALCAACEKLERLASSNAFDMPFALDKSQASRELLARINYAEASVPDITAILTQREP